MPEFTINVSDVEELQTIKNLDELNKIFARAQSTVIQGGSVVLVRGTSSGEEYKFDELTTEADVENYKQAVFKYL